MSVVFGDALNHPIRRWPVTLAWGTLTAHLFGVFMPEWIKPYDPIGYTARTLGRRLRTNGRQDDPGCMAD